MAVKMCKLAALMDKSRLRGMTLSSLSSMKNKKCTRALALSRHVVLSICCFLLFHVSLLLEATAAREERHFSILLVGCEALPL